MALALMFGLAMITMLMIFGAIKVLGVKRVCVDLCIICVGVCL